MRAERSEMRTALERRERTPRAPRTLDLVRILGEVPHQP